MRRIVVVAVALLLAVAPAQAITYGELDGNRHPNVGAMVIRSPRTGDLVLFCSGTLISPTVFLTASHCTGYLESIGVDEVWVTFDSEFTSRSKLIPGTMHTNPNYNQVQSDPGDIAVITFAKPVRDLTPAKLPRAGLFDQMAAKGGLHGQTFTAVGYGVHEPIVGNGPPVWPEDTLRWTSTSSFSALNEVWLRLSQNNATGDGGTCYGDSGGPNFLGTSDTVAVITVTGDWMCLSTNVTYRLDTLAARNFLDDFVTLP